MEESRPVQTNIAHYRILSLLGAAGMGEVYLGQTTDFKAEGILKFDWSRDARLIVSRGVTNRDVVLINFR